MPMRSMSFSRTSMVVKLRAAILHLLDVHFARERVGELAGRLVLAGVQRRDFRRYRRVLVMAMDVDAQAAAFRSRTTFGRGGSTRPRQLFSSSPAREQRTDDGRWRESVQPGVQVNIMTAFP